MRDPSICQAPDGTFHMVWTSSWTDRIIGYASSRDLIHWSEQQAIPVMMHEPEAHNLFGRRNSFMTNLRNILHFLGDHHPRTPQGSAYQRKRKRTEPSYVLCHNGRIFVLSQRRRCFQSRFQCDRAAIVKVPTQEI